MYYKQYLFLFVLIVTLFSEWLGLIKIPLGFGSVVLLPLLYAVVLGIFFSSPFMRNSVGFFKRHINDELISYASKVLGIVMLPLGLKLGFMVGAKIDVILKAGPAFILAQLGHFAPILFAFPLALFFNMKRELLGSCVSIGREPTLGIMNEKFGGDSEEVFGSISIYIIGTVFGTIIFSIIGSLAVFTHLHPYALAMGSGVGSASMMTAGVASLTAQMNDPAMKEQVLAFGVTANLLSTLTEAYIVNFITLPIAQYFYKKKYAHSKGQH